MRQRADQRGRARPGRSSSSCLGQPWLTLGARSPRGLAAVEAFRLLRAPGSRPAALLGTALALVVVLGAAAPDRRPGAGRCLVAVGDRARRASPRSADRTRATGFPTWLATVFGALYVSLLAFSRRPRPSRRRSRDGRRPRTVLGAGTAWLLLLILAVWAFDTFAYLVGQALQARASSSTTSRPTRPGAASSAGRRGHRSWSARSACGPRGRPDPAVVLGLAHRAVAPRPATSPSRCSSGPPAPRTRARSSRATAASSTASTRSCSRRPSFDPVSSSPSLGLTLESDPHRAPPGRAARLDRLDRAPGARRPRRAPGRRFEVVALAAGRDAATLAEQAAASAPAPSPWPIRPAWPAIDLPPGTERVGDADALEALATRDDVDLVVVGDRRRRQPAARCSRRCAPARSWRPPTRRRSSPAATWSCRSRGRSPRRVAATAPHDPLASPLAWLRPIDSEHSAIWQCLAGEPMDDVAALILTASGGPFRDVAAERARGGHPAATPWRTRPGRMGAKITIDSATLMNKGLEVIEAHWLYDVGYDAIDVVIHPQSLVHSARRVRRRLAQGPARTP